MELAIDKKLKNEYPQLSQWEKLFVVNFYNNKNPRPLDKSNKYDIQKMRSDMNIALANYYAFIANSSNFKIAVEGNESLLRAFDGEIAALRARGDGEVAEYFLQNKENQLATMAAQHSETLHAEAKHIVDYIIVADFEPAFKLLMINETMTKVYKRDASDKDKAKTFVVDRILNQTIDGHMVLNEPVLKAIYKKVGDYDNFAKLYYAGLVEQNEMVMQANTVSINSVATYGKGQWVRFPGRKSDNANFAQNAQNLATLVRETPWCTKTLASSQLESGDFYVFVDNEQKPHIAVKLSGNTIGEVRGIQNDNAQELEEEYRDVAISFLENNKDVKMGMEWLEREETNKRIIGYNDRIRNGEQVPVEEMPQLLKDLEFKDYFAHGGDNSNLEFLKENLSELKPSFAKHFGCNEKEILVGRSVITLENEPKIFFGVPNPGKYHGREFSKLQIMYGDLTINGFDHLRGLGSLEVVAKSLCLEKSYVEDLGKLKRIGEYADFSHTSMESLNNLEEIGRSADFSYSEIEDIGMLKRIGLHINCEHSKIRSLKNVEEIGGSAHFKGSLVEDLGVLEIIKGTASFNEHIKDFGRLKYVGEVEIPEENIELREKFRREFHFNKETSGFERLPEYLLANTPKTVEKLNDGTSKTQGKECDEKEND